MRRDPVVIGIALLVAVVGLLAGAGAWAVAAGVLVLVAGGGARVAGDWAAARAAAPPAGSAERALWERAQNALRAMRRMAAAAPAGPVATRCRQVEGQARAALPTIRSLARQAHTVRQLVAAQDLGRLKAERRQATRALAAAPDPALGAELEIALRATDSQLATAARLESLARQLNARTQGLTNSLEGIAAGLGELVALSHTDASAQPHGPLARLSAEVDALRGGLEEAQDLSRRVTAIHTLEA
jgi:hypothetical protein